MEDNYFHKCDGESEIISNKSCENTCHHNWFNECAGASTRRYGHLCLVDGNVFMGKQANRTNGVRIVGQGNRVTNNCFEAILGDAERAAICLMNGIPNDPLNGYAPVRDTAVSNNTYLACKVPMELGIGFSNEQTIAPLNCQTTHNLFSPGTLAARDTIAWENGVAKVVELNIQGIHGTETQPITLRANTPGDVIVRGESPFKVGAHCWVIANNLISSDQGLLVTAVLSAAKLQWIGNLMHGAPVGAEIASTTADPRLSEREGLMVPK